MLVLSLERLAVFVAAAWFAPACVPLLCEQCAAVVAQGGTVKRSPPKVDEAWPWRACEARPDKLDRATQNGMHPQPTSPIQSPDGVRPFAEGVRIDWPKLTVEVDAEVVLRQGPLELFACSPRTKEHESILSVPAKAVHIFQALGLIGLTPGKPLRFNEETKQWEEPRGDQIVLRVRYADGRGTHEAASEQWVLSAKGPDPAQPAKLDWVFAGSTNLPDGRFAADLDGTIACLVDFESALITLRSRHSADNEQLWLTANTKEIPPRGTKCTLLIRSDHPPIVEVELLNEHTARYKNESLTAELLANVLNAPPYDNRAARLIICPTKYVSDDAVADFVEKITKSGFQGTIETKRRLSKEHVPPPD